jgi:hypothetical protein
MRIQWLNLEMTKALLIRGRWWWKRVAEVERKVEGYKCQSGVIVNWLYIEPNRWCEQDIDADIDHKRREERTWRRPGKLPSAKLLTPAG